MSKRTRRRGWHGWGGVERLEAREYLTGSIAGVVFVDLDGDGVQGDGEAGLAAVTVFLDANDNGELDGGEAQAVTNADGEYLFENVAAGDYIVRVVVPDGFEQTGPNTDLEAILRLRRIATGLQRPLFVTTAPGNDNLLYVVEQGGAIRIYDRAAQELLAQPFLQLFNTSFVDDGDSEGGLLGLAFDPDFEDNGFFYVNYTNVLGNTVVERYTVSDGDPNVADPGTVLHILGIEQPDPYHNGGWLGFGPHGYLYIATGDGNGDVGNDPLNNAQDITNNLLGKILRIDVHADDFPGDPDRNYGIPPSNPFVGVNGDDEIWAYGLRNPWRASFDIATGDFYIADVGQDTREEINFQPADSAGGENYGWRLREGLIATPGVGGPKPAGNVDPIFDYGQSIVEAGAFSITGGYVYRGPITPLQGHYFFGDFINPHLWSIEHDGAAVTSFTDWTSIITPEAGSLDLISSFGQDSGGNLFVVDYGFQAGQGEVFELVATSPYAGHAVTVLAEQAVVGLNFAAAEASEDVLLGDEGGKSVTWTDADGTTATATFKGGDANFIFSGDNLVQTLSRGKVTIEGENVRLTRIELSNTTDKSALTIKGKGGDGFVSVQDIVADGLVGKIDARVLDLLGDITIAGPLLKLTIHNADADHTISIGASENPRHALTLVANDLFDTSLISGIGVKSVKVNNWLDTGGDAEMLAAPWWSKAAVAGDFNIDVNLSGAGAAKETLGTFTAKGDITGGTWDVDGAGGGKAIAANNITGLNADFAGPLAKVTAKVDASLNIIAVLISAVKAGGDVTDSTLRATGAFAVKTRHVGSVAVKGDIIDSVIEAVTGNVNSVQARSLQGSRVSAGVNDLGGAALPSVAGDFAVEAFVKSVTLKNKGAFAFVNSTIAGWTLGKLTLGMIQTNNGGQAFGVAGDTIAALTALDAEGAKINLKKLDTAEQVEADLADMMIVLV